MIEFLQRLFIGHVHNWEKQREGDWEREFRGKRITVGQFVDCKCAVCGKWARFNLMD